MSPLDPNIILRSVPPPTPIQSPMEVLSAITQIQGVREQAEARRAATEERRQAGEERRQKAADEAAKRAREADIDSLLQRAVTRDATTGELSVDYDQLIGHLPADKFYEVKKQFDEDKTRLIDLRTKTTALEKDHLALRGSVARSIEASNYDPTVWGIGVRVLRNAGALTPEQATQAEAITDPEQMKRLVTAAKAAEAEAKLEKIETVDAEGKPVTKFVQPSAGSTYPVAPPKPPTPAYQQKDVLLDGKPAIVTFDSHSGKSFVGDQDVTARVRPIPPQGPGPEPIVSIIGPDGKPIYVTRSQALGKTPGGAADAPGGIKLTAGQQDDLATMLTVQQLAADATTLGNEIGWAGVGPWQGRVGATALGSGGTKGETLRNKIGNIKGTIAKLRGGTSFTPNEQALLESYTPTETDPDWKIQAKLASMVDFIEKKRANTLRVARGEYTLPASSGSATTAPDGSTGGDRTPRVGERRTFNGRVGEWDGRGWKAVP